MNFKIALMLGILACSLSLFMCEDSDDQWESFKNVNRKSYRSNEEVFRKKIFQRNLKFIADHNKAAAQGLETYTLDVNENADLTLEEFIQYKLGARVENATLDDGSDILVNSGLTQNTLPSSVDWRTSGCVAQIRNQGTCGSCWAFAAVTALESAICLKTKRLVHLSEQQLVDCAGSYGNYGCNGGLMDNAYRYIRANGITTRATYPYLDRLARCRYTPAMRNTTVSSFVRIPQGSESQLTQALATVGPVSIAVDVTQKFQFYKSGVFTDSTCRNSINDIKHAVVAVGYGTSTTAGDYYIVHNSWGTNWGMNGYIWMARNRNNHCAVATYAVYPIV